MLATTEISFGSFRLLPSQHLLLEGGKPVTLGSRAMDILLALIERPGELVTKDELMARVWPSVFVDPANLACSYFCASPCPPGPVQWKSIYHQYPWTRLSLRRTNYLGEASEA